MAAHSPHHVVAIACKLKSLSGAMSKSAWFLQASFLVLERRSIRSCGAIARALPSRSRFGDGVTSVGGFADKNCRPGSSMSPVVHAGSRQAVMEKCSIPLDRRLRSHALKLHGSEVLVCS